MEVKIALAPEDIKAIADMVILRLKPLLSDRGVDDVLFDVKELAEYLRIKSKKSESVSTKWIYERTHLKEIPHIKVGGLLRFRKGSIDKWLAKHSIPDTSGSTEKLKLIKNFHT